MNFFLPVLLVFCFILPCKILFAQIILGTKLYIQNFNEIQSGLSAGFTVCTGATALGVQLANRRTLNDINLLNFPTPPNIFTNSTSVSFIYQAQNTSATQTFNASWKQISKQTNLHQRLERN